MSKRVTISQALDTIRKAFTEDPDYRRSWVDNIACCIMDTSAVFKSDKPGRDALAERIVNLMFERD